MNFAILWDLWWSLLHIVQQKQEQAFMLLLPPLVFFVVFACSNIRLLITCNAKKVFPLLFLLNKSISIRLKNPHHPGAKKRFLKLLCFKFFFVISICLLWRLMELLLLRCYFYTKSSFQRWTSSTFHEDHMECMRNSHKSLRSRDLGKELSLVVKRWTRGVTAKSEAFLLLKKKKAEAATGILSKRGVLVPETALSRRWTIRTMTAQDEPNHPRRGGSSVTSEMTPELLHASLKACNAVL